MNRDELAKQLVIDEGMRTKPYNDTVGKMTIGVGRNLADRGITEQEAMYLLANDIESIEADLDRALPWWREMTERRQQTLANMAFNMGIFRLLGFKNTLAAMQSGDYVQAHNGMLTSKWAEQVGARASRLADMMLKG